MSILNKTISAKTLILGLIIITVVLLIWASGKDKEEYKPTPIPPVDNYIPEISQKDKNWYAFRDAYLEGCEEDSSGGDYAFCECTIDYMEDNYGRNAVINMGVDYIKTGDLGQIMFTAVNECIIFLE